MNTAVKHISLIVTGALMASAVASCGNAAPVETETAVPESVPSVEASVSESETTEEEIVYTEFSVETEPHENPFADFINENSDNAIEYNYSIINSVISASGSDAFKSSLDYGFDNPYVIKELQDKVYEYTGVSDSSITLSDVNYFQTSEVANEFYGSDIAFSLAMSNSGVSVEALRAVFSYLGLKFGIDEIPASFLIERFPRFYYDEFEGTDPYQFQDTIEINDPCVNNETFEVNLGYYDSIKDMQDANALDVILFQTCLYYNKARINCIYGHPYGDDYSGFILQVRDADTGKNVLVPTLEQAEVIQTDISSIPGCEDVDIYMPQTSDDFYAIYGYYPEELLQVRNDSVNAPVNAQEYIDYLQNIGA